MFELSAREWHEPLALHRALANAPALLPAYNALAQALRHGAATPRPLRELVVLRVAQLTASEYEWAHHRPMGADAGLSEEKVSALAGWRTSGAFDEPERAALRCADEMHELALSDEAFDELRAALSDSGAVEIVLLVAFYEAVARVIQALGLEVEPGYRRFLADGP